MTNYDKMLNLVRDCGMDYKWSKMFIKKFADDEKAFSLSDEEKKWALQRGFFPGRIKLYGINENNYTEFLPDWNYFTVQHHRSLADPQH